MGGQIIIPYAPRNWAKELHNSIIRWIVLVLHRRAGKTTAVLNHLQRDCLKISESQFAYIGPTYKQAKRVAWDIIKKYSRDIPGIDYNESELTVKYPNGSKLILVGSDNPDSLRGLALWGVGFDEYSQQPSNIFSEIISKCLADHLGYAIFFGTPKGKNEFHRIYQAALNNPEWTAILKTIDDSLRDEKGETIENLRQALEDDKKLVAQGLMTQEEFDQEWYCSFEATIKGAYYAKEIAQARKDGRIRVVPYDTALKVHTVWDLGKGKNLAIGFYQAGMEGKRMIDFWEGTASEGIKDAAVILQNKGYLYGKHFAPHDIKQTEITTGKTRIDSAKDYGIDFEVVPEIGVDAGIEQGRRFWSRLWVDENHCSVWVDAISQYRQEWDDRKGMFIEKPVHDWTSHKGDVHRYAAVIADQMTNEDETTYVEEEYKSLYPNLGV
jgi:phage terminase large subunit